MADPLVEILRNVTAELERRESPGEPVPLRMDELPDGKLGSQMPCLWLDKAGRVHPAVAYRIQIDRGWIVSASLAYHAAFPGSTQHALSGSWPSDPVLYPESAAPALWSAFLARRVGSAA